MMPQVNSSHYFERYDSKYRWINYWHQINEVLSTRAHKILEVGIGNSTVSDYLRRVGKDVTTIDIDPNLKPDYVGNVKELSKIFGENKFDLILCSEVLEHLPFEDFESTLNELWKVTKEYVVISLPYACIVFFTLHIPKISKGISFRIPKFWAKHKFDGQHYWEIGKKNYSLNRIIELIERKFELYKIEIPLEDSWRIIFSMRKKNKIASKI
jgi:hypothetical protein